MLYDEPQVPGRASKTDTLLPKMAYFYTALMAQFATALDTGRMKPSPFYNRMVDVMEELMKFTLLTRDNKDCLLDRYSERKESAAELSKRVDQKSI